MNSSSLSPTVHLLNLNAIGYSCIAACTYVVHELNNIELKPKVLLLFFFLSLKYLRHYVTPDSKTHNKRKPCDTSDTFTHVQCAVHVLAITCKKTEKYFSLYFVMQ